MKLSKEELKKKIDEKVVDEDVKIELLEDVEDSFETEDNGAIVELQAKYDELKEKYKARFLDGESSEDEGEKSEDEELEEVEEIDVEEI